MYFKKQKQVTLPVCKHLDWSVRTTLYPTLCRIHTLLSPSAEFLNHPRLGLFPSTEFLCYPCVVVSITRFTAYFFLHSRPFLLYIIKLIIYVTTTFFIYT